MKTLSEYLASEGITQSDFAKAVGVSRSYLSEIVAGVKVPSLEVALKIRAKACNKVSLDTLVKSPVSASSKEAS